MLPAQEKVKNLVTYYSTSLARFIEKEEDLNRAAIVCAKADATNTLEQIDKHNFSKKFLFEGVVKILNKI